MKQNLFFDITNVAESNGYSLSFVGIFIVFTTLLIISLFVWALPHILRFADYFSTKEVQTQDDEVALAISVVLNNQRK